MKTTVTPWRVPKLLECHTCHWTFGTPEALANHRRRGHQLRVCPCGTRRVKHVTSKLEGKEMKERQHTEYRCPNCGSVAMSKDFNEVTAK
jgi:hypothetical protein